MDDGKNLIGLRISAGLLVALGCIFALYVLLFGLLLGISLVHLWEGRDISSDKPESLIGLVLFVAILAAFTYLCFRASKALSDAKVWASYVAMGFGLMLLSFSAVFFYDWFHPERQSPDEYFGILIVPFWIAIGLWWCIYLNLPGVRAHLKSCS